jgi:hypothetical protein
MRIWPIAWIVVGAAALSGCVLGKGPCLILEPIKVTLTGKVHFRSYPARDGVDNVPILSLDRTAYVYAPAQSHQCLPANDVQLVGLSEMPPDIHENAGISVTGSLFQAVSDRDHTRFLINVTNIQPLVIGHE